MLGVFSVRKILIFVFIFVYVGSANSSPCEINSSHLNLMKQYFNCASTNKLNACHAVGLLGILAGSGYAGFKLNEAQTARARKGIVKALTKSRDTFFKEGARVLGYSSFVPSPLSEEIPRDVLNKLHASDLQEKKLKTIRNLIRMNLSDDESNPKQQLKYKKYLALKNALTKNPEAVRLTSIYDLMEIDPPPYGDLKNPPTPNDSIEFNVTDKFDVKNRTKRTLRQYDDLIKQVDSGKMNFKGLSEFQEDILGKAMLSAEKSGANIVSMSERLAMVGKISRTAVKVAGGAVVGGTILGTFVQLIATQNNTGCDELNDRTVNRKVESKWWDILNVTATCKSGDHALSQGTAEFLDKSVAEQNAILSDPKVCSFYKDWYREIFSTKAVNLSCSGNNADVKIQMYWDGKEQTVPVRYQLNSEELKSVSIYPDSDAEIKLQTGKGWEVLSKSYPGLTKASQSRSANDGDSMRATMMTETLQKKSDRVTQLLPMVSKQIVGCCQSNSTEQQKCLNDINGTASNNNVSEKSKTAL
jgi:hypothetical protein